MNNANNTDRRYRPTDTNIARRIALRLNKLAGSVSDQGPRTVENFAFKAASLTKPTLFANANSVHDLDRDEVRVYRAATWYCQARQGAFPFVRGDEMDLVKAWCATHNLPCDL